MDANSINKTSLISATYQQQAAVQPPKSAATDNPPKQQSGASTAARDTVQVSTKVTLRNLDTSRAIEQMHANLNQQAKSVRETNEATYKVVDKIDTMRSNLQGIIKNFPPFPVDSKERNAILMGYTALRKELIRLMVPPPPPPVYEKVEAMWSSLFDQDGQIRESMTPDLNNKSSDAEVNDAAAKLVSASSGLAELSDKVTQALLNP